MFRWFGNISVNLKLTLGFGLVLLLTVLITLTGWLALDATLQRGDKLGASAKLSEMTKDLRIARQEYQVKQEPATADKVNAALMAMEAFARELDKELSDPEDHALIEQEEAALSAYRQAFGQLGQAYQAREAARTQLGASADAAVQAAAAPAPRASAAARSTSASRRA
eukprot:gene5913-7349_t